MRAERQVLFWMAAALVLVLLIGLLKDILLPFVAGMVIAYFLNPLAATLERMGLSRTWASVLILLVAIVAFAALLIFVVPLLATQAQQLAVALPDQLERLKGILDAWARERLGPRYPAFETSSRRPSRACRRTGRALPVGSRPPSGIKVARWSTSFR